MKINFEQELFTLNKESIRYNTKDKTRLLDVALDALLTPTQDEANLSGVEKAKRYVLSTRIYSNPSDIDLTAEEVTTLKNLIGKLFGPLVVGQAYAILENQL